MTIDSLLDKLCTIQRRTLGNAVGPERSVTWYDHLRNVPCRLVRRSGAEQYGRHEAIVMSDTFFLPYGTDITEQDRIDYGGNAYDVEHVKDDPGGVGSHMEVLTRRTR